MIYFCQGLLVSFSGLALWVPVLLSFNSPSALEVSHEAMPSLKKMMVPKQKQRPNRSSL